MTAILLSKTEVKMATFAIDNVSVDIYIDMLCIAKQSRTLQYYGFIIKSQFHFIIFNQLSPFRTVCQVILTQHMKELVQLHHKFYKPMRPNADQSITRISSKKYLTAYLCKKYTNE